MAHSYRGWIRTILLLAIAFGIAACSQDASTPIEPVDSGGLGLSAKANGKPSADLQAELAAMIDGMNGALAARSAPYRVLKIETISGDPSEIGITVLWKDVGNKRLEDDFVPGDPRRAAGSPEGGWSADPNTITYAIDQVDATTLNGVSPAVTNAEIRSAMMTWDDVQCSALGIEEVATASDLGFVAAFFGLGGSFDVVADVQHAGWLEVEFGGATVAATATVIWVDGVTGVPTDIDGNGMVDVAFREIYYDAICDACVPLNFWKWEVDNGLNDVGIDVDIQSIALHESGHGLSQDHFGIGFIGGDGFLHLTSNSVMAAAYVFPRTDLQGSDVGGHCANWGSWPNN